MQSVAGELEELAGRLQDLIPRLLLCSCRAAGMLAEDVRETLQLVDGVLRGYYKIRSMDELRRYARELLADAEGVLRACGC
ncbi:MAG: hypothetical protein GSR78_04790 [Desulfurococcales archaeon]|nr:hypothetical protein [Desulfurococcales archaeon]